jgi:hypothetical protein
MVTKDNQINLKHTKKTILLPINDTMTIQGSKCKGYNIGEIVEAKTTK